MWRHDVISFQSLETVAMQGYFIIQILWPAMLRTRHVCTVHDSSDAGEQHSKHGGERHVLLRRVVVRVVSCK